MLERFFRNEKDKSIDEQIDAVFVEMNNNGVLSDEYSTLMGYLERLTDVKKKHNLDPVSHDTIALIVGNLLGVALIAVVEAKGHIFMSKGFNQIIRPRSIS